MFLAFADWDAIERQITAGRPREALVQLELDTERSTRWHVLASKAHDALNDPVRAVAEAEAALKLDPQSEPAHVQLGYIFLSRNTPLAAVEVFTEAERLFPQSIIVRLGKGLALKELQRYDEAEKTLAACWPHPIAFDAHATVLVQRGKFEEAKDLAKRFIEIAREDYRGYPPDEEGHLLDRYLHPRPRVRLAPLLRAHASAAMDVSDGLAGDLAKLLRASAATAIIDTESVPLSGAARAALAADPSLIDRILTGGDDYEVLCTVPEAQLEAFQDHARAAGIAAVPIGQVMEGGGLPAFVTAGTERRYEGGSFSHF